jgi:DNA polymerase I-like protein with 3'-5' exonuclease and polymerase domains
MSKIKWSPDGPQSTFVGPSSPAVIIHWLRERFAIERGEGSADEVIHRGRFCRTRRQDDRGTRWLHEHWLEPHRDDPTAIFFLSLLYRCCINDGRVAGELSLPFPWDPARYLAEMRARRAEGKPTEHFGHHAYTIYAYPGFDFKPEGHVERLLNRVWERREYYRQKVSDTCTSFSSRLRELTGINSFYAGQVVIDCAAFPPLCDAPDAQSFALPGPGSEPGLARVLGKPLNYYKGKERLWSRDFNHLFEQLSPELAQITGAPFSAAEFQSALCEVNKLERYRIDHGALQLYEPFNAEAASKKAQRKPRPKSTPSVDPTPTVVTTTSALATEPQPYARTLFAQLARPFIMPVTAGEHSEGLRLVFDIEADNLLDACTVVHCIVIGELDGDRVHEYGPDQIPDALEHLARADVLVGHNERGFDLRVLKLHGWAPRPECRIIDTLIAARLILPHLDAIDTEVAARTKDPAFGRMHGRHRLEDWGLRLGMPKIGTEIYDFSKWSPELQARCVGDVATTKRLFRFLQPDGYPRAALELEHYVAAVCDQIVANGVPFDTVAAERLCEQWEARRAELEERLRAQFPEVKNFNARPQIAAVLEARGWRPERRTEKTQQPVIDDEVLEALPAIYPEFTGLAEHALLGSRLGQLANGKQAWLGCVDPNGRIHGGIIHIGTPHSRAKHLQPNIAAVPNPKKGAKLAAECRALFRHPGDWVFVRCDQSNLQDRAFANYLAAYDGGAYAQTFAEGIDQHWRAAIALGLIPEGTERDKDNKVHTAIREGAKAFRYAFIFGAGSLRAGQMIAGIVRTVVAIAPGHALATKFWGGEKHPSEAALRQAGKRALDRFVAATPGLRELRARLQMRHRQRGWVGGLDGRRIPTEADYKALNRLVTASEAVICKRWLINVHAELRSRFRYGPDGDCHLALWVHDELVACCRPEIAEQVGEIMVRYAVEAGEYYGFKTPLAAEFKIGRSWAGESGEPAPKSPPTPSVPVGSSGVKTMHVELFAFSLVTSPPIVPTANMGLELAGDDLLADLLDGDDKGGDGGDHGHDHGGDGAADCTPPTWTEPGLTEVSPLGALRPEDRAVVRPPRANGGGGKPNGGPGATHSSGGQSRNYDAPEAGKPYGPIRAALLAKGYHLARTFPFALPDGRELYYEDRFELRAGIAPTKECPHKTSRFWHASNGQALSGTGPRRIIFNWPAIMAAGPGSVVHVTEGANKSAPLNAAGLLATAAAYHQWTPECVDALAGRHIIIHVDHNPEGGNDPGPELAADARAKLAPRAASIRVVPAALLFKHLVPPREPWCGADVKDWIDPPLNGDPARLLEICREIPAEGDFCLAPLTLAEWRARELPPLDPVMGEMFTTTTRMILHADTGLGKTHFGVALLGHAASGTDFLHWSSSQPRRVLYIDGEMSRRLFKERLEDMMRRLGASPPGFLAFNREDIESFAPLNTKEGQAALWKLIEEAEHRAGGPLEAICFDNVMSLLAGDMKEEDAWRDTLPLIRALTKRRIGQLWLHHTGHDTSRGYGTKTREWQLDVVAHLNAVERPDTDVSFTLTFPKARDRCPRNRDDFAEVNIALVDDRWISETATAGKADVPPMAIKFFEALEAAARKSSVAYLGGHPAASLADWQAECIAMGLIDPKAKADSARSLFSKNKLQLIAANWIAANADSTPLMASLVRLVGRSFGSDRASTYETSL